MEKSKLKLGDKVILNSRWAKLAAGYTGIVSAEPQFGSRLFIIKLDKKYKGMCSLCLYEYEFDSAIKPYQQLMLFEV